MKFGILTNYQTGQDLRYATRRELRASKRAAKVDGGSGTIQVKIDGNYIFCFVA